MSLYRLNSLFKNKSIKEKVSVEDVEKSALQTIPVGRFGDVSDITNAVLFLSSPKASYINGINLPVDGGRTVSL